MKKQKDYVPFPLYGSVGHCSEFRRSAYCPTSPYFFITIMIANINNFGVINYYEQNATKQEPAQKAEPVCEDITPDSPSVTSETIVPPVGKEFDSDISDSIIFTKKAKKEGKEAYILQALQKSVQGRKDKTRAFVEELQSWQKDGYVDAHYNSRVMYDELDKLIPLPFGKEVFKKHYNNTRG